MNIFFQCPVCGRQYEVGPHQAGMEILCLGCNRKVIVPRPLDPLGRDGLRPSGRPRLSKSHRKTVLVASIGGGVALLLAVILLLVFNRGDDSPSQHSPDVAQADFNPTPDLNERRLPTALTAEPRQDDRPVADESASESTSESTSDSTSDSEVIETQILVDTNDPVTLGGPGCSVVVVGTTVWDLEERKVLAELVGEYPRNSVTDLSADGRYFAATEKMRNSSDNGVFVWETASGKRLFHVPGELRGYTDLLEIAGDRLFLGGRSSSRLTIWSLSQAREERTFDLPGKSVERKNTAITHNGLYVATIDEDKLVVLKIETGERIVRMRPPKHIKTNLGPKPPPGMVRVDQGGWIIDEEGGSADARECRSIYSSLKALEFSPDSRELVAISTHPDLRVMCWNHEGRRMVDERLYIEDGLSGENPVAWFPGKKAWLLGNHVYDRESEKVVLSVAPSVHHVKLHVHDDDHLVGTLPDSKDESPFPKNEVQVIEVPWEGIRASLAQLKEDVPALLSPAQPVSIVFDLGPLRGDQNKTVQELGDSFKERLSRDGLKVEKGQSTFFRIRFWEKAGDSVAIYERKSRFGWGRGHDTGRRVKEAEGDLIVELVVPGKDEPVWRDSLSASSATSYRVEINESTVRDSMIENLANRMNDLVFPYFIPESEDLLALPVILQ